MSFNKIIPIFVLIGIIVIGAGFVPQILGTVEAGQAANISVAYQNQLNSTRDVSITTITITKFFSPLLAVLIIIILGMLLIKSSSRRRRR